MKSKFMVALLVSSFALPVLAGEGDRAAQEEMAKAQRDKIRNDRIVEQQRQRERDAALDRLNSQVSPTPTPTPTPTPGGATKTK